MTAPTPMIRETSASPEEIQLVVDKIASVIEDVNPAHAIMAMLAMSMLIMNPFLDADEISEAVRETSQFICLQLSGKGTIPEDASDMPSLNEEKKMMN